MLYLSALILPSSLNIERSKLKDFLHKLLFEPLKIKTSDSKTCERILGSIHQFEEVMKDPTAIKIGNVIRNTDEYWELGLILTISIKLLNETIIFKDNNIEYKTESI